MRARKSAITVAQNRLLGVLSLGCSVIALIVMFYGAWVHDAGLVTKEELFLTLSLPITLSGFFLWIGDYK